MKRIAALLLALSLVLSLMAGCGGKSVVTEEAAAPVEAAAETETEAAAEETAQPEATPVQYDLKIGVITGTGGLGDNNVNDAVYGGVVKACEELGMTVDVVEPTETADIELYLTDFAQDGEYDLIVANSSGAKAPVSNVSVLYPEQKFLLVDNGIKDIANVASLTFNKMHEGFLSGIVCAYVAGYSEIVVNGKTIALDNSAKTLGCILGIENPDGIEAVSGFMSGVRYIDPDINILYTANGSWSDQGTAREIALAQYSQGAQMIWQDAGSASAGVFTAAADSNLFTMGWNNVQHTVDPEHILFSVVKDITSATYQWIYDWATTGEFVSGQKDFSCVQGTVYIVWNDAWDAPEEVRKAVDTAFGLLQSGELTPPSTFEELENFTLRYGG